MNKTDKKSSNIGFRCSKEVREAAEYIAAQKTGGVLAPAMEEIILAVADNIKLHGNRAIWPPEMNYFPPGTITAQDITNAENE